MPVHTDTFAHLSWLLRGNWAFDKNLVLKTQSCHSCWGLCRGHSWFSSEYYNWNPDSRPTHTPCSPPAPPALLILGGQPGYWTLGSPPYSQTGSLLKFACYVCLQCSQPQSWLNCESQTIIRILIWTLGYGWRASDAYSVGACFQVSKGAFPSD